MLNGNKIFITNAPKADTYVVFAVTTPDIGTRGISAFIVEKGYEGFDFGDHYDKMGIRSSSTAELIFNDVKVPKENLLGKEGEGFKIAMATLDGGRIGIASQALGIAQGAFENIHPIPRGVSYNSYVLIDEKTVLFDTADWSACRQFLENLEYVLDGRDLDYMVINHMEPNHGASLEEVLLRYPNVTIISTAKAFMLMRQFGFQIDGHELVEVVEGDTYCFGSHTVTFVAAPMVHWPEAMVIFDVTNGVLFAADAFGSFGALDGKLFNDEVNFDRDWIDDARRYYTNIVGKYGPHVQLPLKKAGAIVNDIIRLCIII